MNEINTKKLNEAFPNLYKVNHEYGFGFECGDGWFDLLWEASEKIEAHLLTMNARERSSFHASQVKEKFGTLRFYMSYHTDEIDAAINAAEARSEVTCEGCGAPGESRGGGWVHTTCNKCEIGSVVRSIVRNTLSNAEAENKLNWKNEPITVIRLKNKEEFETKAVMEVVEQIFKILNIEIK